MTNQFKLRVAMVMVIGIVSFAVWWNWKTAKQGKTLFSEERGFWRGEVRHWPDENAKDGYLVTQNLIPLRAIARRPNVPLFSNPKQDPVESFRKIMKPWKPYYVFEYDAERAALRVAEQSRIREGNAFWVLESDVYCWTTREVLDIEQPRPLYGSLDDAKADRNRLEGAYIYRYSEHAGSEGQEGRKLLMDGLPVLRREEGKYWSFIQPDPRPDPVDASLNRPYQVRWVHWEANDDSAAVRLRVTRSEFTEYTVGLRKLLYDWEYGSSADKSDAQTEMLRTTQRNITGEKKQESNADFTITQINSRTAGIPHPSGLLISGILNPLQAENIKQRLNNCFMMGNDRSLWGTRDIAYIEVDRMP